MGMDLLNILVRLMADGALVPIVLIGAYLLLFRIKNSDKFAAYSRILMSGLTAYLVAKYMSAIYHPATERPFELMGVAAGAAYLPNPGFPSDHALFSTAILYAVWFETRAKNWSILLAILVLTVCVGRVAALVHTPLDVIGGVVAASAGALWYFTPRRTKA